MQHRVDGARDRQAGDDVVLDEREARSLEEVGDLVAAAGGEVVDGDDLVAGAPEGPAHVPADEPGAARHDRPRHQRPMPR